MAKKHVLAKNLTYCAKKYFTDVFICIMQSRAFRVLSTLAITPGISSKKSGDSSFSSKVIIIINNN